MIYGLTGKKRSGKSESARFIMNKMGAVHVNFKDQLIAEIKRNFPTMLTELVKLLEKVDYDGQHPLTQDTIFDIKQPVVRALLQNYGTEVRRNDDPDYWVDQWWKQAKMIINIDHSHIVTDDVRFLNEAQAVRDLGGVIIKIVRIGQVSTDTHQSEIEMDMIEPDYTLNVAEGDIADLHKKLDKITDWIK